MRITGTGRDLARERCEAPLMIVTEPVCSLYVDNINGHGITSESCDRRHEVIIAALEAFSLHEISRASQHHKQLDVCFGGVARVLRNDLVAFGGSTLLLASAALAVSAPSAVSVPGSSA